MIAHTIPSTLYMSRFTYPNKVFYEQKLEASPGADGTVYLPAAGNQADVMYCNMEAQQGILEIESEIEFISSLGAAIPGEPSVGKHAFNKYILELLSYDIT